MLGFSLRSTSFALKSRLFFIPLRLRNQTMAKFTKERPRWTSWWKKWWQTWKNQDSKHVQENLRDSLSRMNQVLTADPPVIVLKNIRFRKFPIRGISKKKIPWWLGRSSRPDSGKRFVRDGERKMEKAENHLKETETGRIIPDKWRSPRTRSVRSGKEGGKDRVSRTRGKSYWT